MQEETLTPPDEMTFSMNVRPCLQVNKDDTVFVFTRPVSDYLKEQGYLHMIVEDAYESTPQFFKLQPLEILEKFSHYFSEEEIDKIQAGFKMLEEVVNEEDERIEKLIQVMDEQYLKDHDHSKEESGFEEFQQHVFALDDAITTLSYQEPKLSREEIALKLLTSPYCVSVEEYMMKEAFQKADMFIAMRDAQPIVLDDNTEGRV